MIRVFLFQRVKEKVNGIFERLIILTDFHCVQHFYQCGKILFVCRSLIIDISDQCRIEQGFCLDPEIVSGFSFAFGIGNQSCDDLQNIFLGVDVGKGVKVHTFLEIDRIEF